MPKLVTSELRLVSYTYIVTLGLITLIIGFFVLIPSALRAEPGQDGGQSVGDANADPTGQTSPDAENQEGGFYGGSPGPGLDSPDAENQEGGFYGKTGVTASVKGVGFLESLNQHPVTKAVLGVIGPVLSVMESLFGPPSPPLGQTPAPSTPAIPSQPVAANVDTPAPPGLPGTPNPFGQNPEEEEPAPPSPPPELNLPEPPAPGAPGTPQVGPEDVAKDVIGMLGPLGAFAGLLGPSSQTPTTPSPPGPESIEPTSPPSPVSKGYSPGLEGLVERSLGLAPGILSGTPAPAQGLPSLPGQPSLPSLPGQPAQPPATPSLPATPLEPTPETPASPNFGYPGNPGGGFDACVYGGLCWFYPWFFEREGP